ncbi:MAG: carbohydrate-binding protein [Deltaproteobacteria bacterium]|nr:carbohydrate-binding protein [Acidobacteriota bacterium]MBV8774820.1 carbohydrate-binding protein [Deltaproteobacteria bacterium]
MRKHIIGQAKTPEAQLQKRWLDLEGVAQVEVTSEDPGFPIESALTLEGEGKGWRASEPGEQLIRIIFDTPTAVQRIKVHFAETQAVRTQEFVLRWSSKRNEALREIVRQQWNFSPTGSSSEEEDYQVNLGDVGVLELAIKPDISGGDSRASLMALRLA